MKKHLFLFTLLSFTSQLFSGKSTVPSNKGFFKLFKSRKKSVSEQSATQYPFPLHITAPEDSPLFSAHGDEFELKLTIHKAPDSSPKGEVLKNKSYNNDLALEERGVKINLNLLAGTLFVYNTKTGKELYKTQNQKLQNYSEYGYTTGIAPESCSFTFLTKKAAETKKIEDQKE